MKKLSIDLFTTPKKWKKFQFLFVLNQQQQKKRLHSTTTESTMSNDEISMNASNFIVHHYDNQLKFIQKWLTFHLWLVIFIHKKKRDVFSQILLQILSAT